MILKGVSFRSVMNASGAQGFFGEGYWYHKVGRPIGLSFQNCGFVAKTTTLHKREGNMPVKKDGITPKQLIPKCILVKVVKGAVLNAVGLSGPGAADLLNRNRWQQRTEPFFISFMSVEETPENRVAELKEFIALLRNAKPDFRTKFGLEINFSCPNTAVNPSTLIDETQAAFDIAAELDCPIQAKFNATMNVDSVCRAATHKACDAITMSNTIPWGMLSEQIKWQKLFRCEKSPLKEFGGGGLSGPAIFPVVCEWIATARRGYGFSKPIWGCGGINSTRAVDTILQCGASGIQIGSVVMTRPHRVQAIIKHANKVIR